jgi:hypothetical protein
MRKKCADEKQLVQLKFGLPDCQPLALFALCTGASSDPMVLHYTEARHISCLHLVHHGLISDYQHRH